MITEKHLLFPFRTSSVSFVPQAAAASREAGPDLGASWDEYQRSLSKVRKLAETRHAQWGKDVHEL